MVSEKKRKAIRKWRQENKERIKIYDQDYYQKNRNKILEQCRKYREENKEKCAKQRHDYFERNKEKHCINTRNYRRKHALHTRGKTIWGLNKRSYVNYCELCGKEGVRLGYHHWNDEHLEDGLWICHNCHIVCEIQDKEGFSMFLRYEKFKKIINKGVKNVRRE